MRFRPLGICKDADSKALRVRASDYSNEFYAGVEIRSDKNRDPVIIMRSKRDNSLPWKVVYGFSQIFFRSFADAVEFCNSRGFKLMKEQVE